MWRPQDVLKGYKSETVSTQVTIFAAICGVTAVFYFAASYIVVFIIVSATCILLRRVSAGNDCKRLQRRTNLAGRVAIVTGANTGIGYYTALQLAEMECTVVITCRSLNLTKQTAERMRSEIAKRANLRPGGVVRIVDTYHLECDDFPSIQNFAQMFLADTSLQIKKKGQPQLDILINNAGMMVKELRFSAHNPRYELHTAVNFLGPALLTELLIGTVKSSSGRVVNVASEAHRVAAMGGIKKVFPALVQVNVGRAEATGPLASVSSGLRTAFLRYGTSKLLNIYYSHYVARTHSVPVCSLHPGVVTTSFARDLVPGLVLPLYEFVSTLWCKTAEEGSQTTVYCAICPVAELDASATRRKKAIPSLYFVECKDQTNELLRAHGWDVEDATAVVKEFALKELAPFLRPAKRTQ